MKIGMREFVILSLLFIVFYPFVAWRYVLAALAALELSLQAHRWYRKTRAVKEYPEEAHTEFVEISEDTPEVVDHWEPVRASLGSRPFAWRNSRTGEMKKYRPDAK